MGLYYLNKIKELSQKFEEDQDNKDLQKEQLQLQEELLEIESKTEDLLSIIRELVKIVEQVDYQEDLIEKCGQLEEKLLFHPFLKMVKRLLIPVKEEKLPPPEIIPECPFCSTPRTPDAYSCPKCHAVLPKLTASQPHEEAYTFTMSDLDSIPDREDIDINKNSLTMIIEIVQKVKDHKMSFERFLRKFSKIKRVLENNFIGYMEIFEETFQIEREKAVTQALQVEGLSEEKAIKIIDCYYEAAKPLLLKCQQLLADVLDQLELFTKDKDYSLLDEITATLQKAEEIYKEYLTIYERIYLQIIQELDNETF